MNQMNLFGEKIKKPNPEEIFKEKYGAETLQNLKCAFCGAEKEKMTIQRHASGDIINLCFMGCQHFPEPYEATGLSNEWIRIDPWIKKKTLPRLRHKRGY